MARKAKPALPGVVTRGTSAPTAAEPTPVANGAPDPFGTDTNGKYRLVALDLIDPDPDQPRKHFDRAALEELADTIRVHGVIQPAEVRVSDGRFVITGGERRWRAAQIAGCDTMPVVVSDPRPVSEVRERQLVENLARDDLKPLETARAIAELVRDHDLTHEAVAKRVGLGRVKVTQLLKLLELPDPVQDLLDEDKLTFAHARALNALTDASQAGRLARRTVDGGWSSRQLEAEVAKSNAESGGEARAPRRFPNADRDQFIVEAENAIRSATGLDIELTAHGKRITVSYTSDAEGVKAYAAKLGAEIPDPIA